MLPFQVQRPLPAGQLHSPDMPVRVAAHHHTRKIKERRRGGQPDGFESLPESRMNFDRAARGTGPSLAAGS
jgi:hypothetical protein